MAWTEYGFLLVPADRRTLLRDAVDAIGSFRRRYRADASDIAVDWGGPIHHATLLAAVALDALLDPAAARRFHAGVRLHAILETVPRMGALEKRLLAAVGGVDLRYWNDHAALPPLFAAHLYPLVERPALRPFFAIAPARGNHYDVQPVEPLSLAKRAKALDTVDRLLLVTICGLYNSSLARAAFKRDWNPPAAEAFIRMNAAAGTDPEAVTHWYGLLATYPGW